MRNTFPEVGIRVSGPLLHGIRLPVQRQHQNIHNQAQGNDR